MFALLFKVVLVPNGFYEVVILKFFSNGHDMAMILTKSELWFSPSA